jgi:hypothetical protein
MFSGDGPARQFEAGQQRGGNYSCICGVHVKDHQNFECCFRQVASTLDERRQVVTSGMLWRRMQNGKVNPFSNLSKEDLVDELESRGIDTFHLSRKPELQESMTNTLHGIQRPPALMTKDPMKSATDLGIEHYEVFGCEPLHDITNIVQNIITELPNHVDTKSIQKEFEDFYQGTIGDKNQIKGSDARLYAVKLAKFTETKFLHNQVSKNILDLVTSLVEVIKICYSSDSTRSKRNILRLYNQTFIFAVLCKTVIGTPVKMTSRKFFGAHFHSLTVHAPEVYRIVSLRSIIPEEEERAFGDLRRISENTSNRKVAYVIDNAVMRFEAQQNDDGKIDSIAIQESVISQQAKLLSTPHNSVIPKDWLLSRPSLVQSHLERISDYLLNPDWWRLTGEGLEFLDGPSEVFPTAAPPRHFRSSSVKTEQILVKETWKEVVDKYKNGELPLPLQRIKTYNKDGKLEICLPNQGNI